MNKIYSICSQCAFSDVVRDGLNNCPRCGSALIQHCPHCEAAIWHRGAKYCHDCGKPLKPDQRA